MCCCSEITLGTKSNLCQPTSRGLATGKKFWSILMDEISDDFRRRVYAIVAQIPKGKVMSYGQIAYLAGSPRAARIVGGIAHWGNPELPWQRVVMKDGGLAPGYPGGTAGHAEV